MSNVRHHQRPPLSNRYAPPESEVADVRVDSRNDERPRFVRIGVGLFVASALLGMVKAALIPVQVGAWVTVFTYSFLALLAVALWNRQNWARILYVVMFALGTIATVFVRAQLLQQGTLSVALLVAQNLMQLATAACLFVRASTDWYKRRGGKAFQGPSADV